MSRYASGSRALGECDRCGQNYLLKELKHLTINRQRSGLKVCPDCWEPDHAQNDAARAALIAIDPQALYDPRPEHGRAIFTNIAWGWNPLYGLQATAQLGTVTVVTNGH